jgi:hypothetical protein
MKKNSTPHLGKALAALSCICIFATSSAWATLVTWSLNPLGLNQDAGSTHVTFTQSGYSIAAYGYTSGSPNTPLGLFYKNQGFDETGLGVVGTAHNELEGVGGVEGVGGAPAQFITLDISKLLASGKVFDGALEIGSVQGSSNDTFNIYGSNTLGTLGTKIGGTFNSSSDLVFLTLADFGSYNYISIGAVSGDVLPVAFQANCIPEMSALFPIVGLIAAVSFTQLLRRRRMAKLSADPSSGV